MTSYSSLQHLLGSFCNVCFYAFAHSFIALQAPCYVKIYYIKCLFCQTLILFFVISQIMLASFRFLLVTDDFLTAVGSPVSTLCTIIYRVMLVVSHPMSLLSEIQTKQKKAVGKSRRGQTQKPDKPLGLRLCQLLSKLRACYQQRQYGTLG